MKACAPFALVLALALSGDCMKKVSLIADQRRAAWQGTAARGWMSDDTNQLERMSASNTEGFARSRPTASVD